MNFTFSHPQYLFFLFALPLLFFIHFLSLSNRKKVALRFANFEAISKIQGVDFFSKNVVTLFLNLFIVFFLILAVSGLTMHVLKEASSFSFVIAIDSSQSMEADDLYPNRLDVSKQTAVEFLETIPFGSKIGIISFSGSSYIEQDLTEDKIELTNAIGSIQLSGFGGTDLYEAVITGSNLLKNEDSKAIILLSDGQINVGTIDDSIDYAHKNDVIIHSIAIGTQEGGMANYAISKVDEDSLKSIAYNTGGSFFSVETGEELSESFLAISSLTEKKVAIGLASYLLVFAIVLFVIQFFLSNTRYLNLP
ncbi:MAG: VWA domain-containing protein [Nanoarchaeota archaeon]|nr:VWA domain-containing protein [Nanoarchaeota archaeon]MBU1027876.1 VWA domain-containing protein [Nanoarchaeota archaeon]